MRTLADSVEDRCYLGVRADEHEEVIQRPGLEDRSKGVVVAVASGVEVGQGRRIPWG